jgi:HEAT repeat protein
MLPLLQDSSPEVRHDVLRALGFMGESAQLAIPQIIPLLQDSELVFGLPGMPISAAAITLGQIGKSAIPQVIPLLQDPNPMVRSNAAHALGFMGESAKSAIPHLIPLSQDADSSVRIAIDNALKKLGYKP